MSWRKVRGQACIVRLRTIQNQTQAIYSPLFNTTDNPLTVSPLAFRQFFTKTTDRSNYVIGNLLKCGGAGFGAALASLPSQAVNLTTQGGIDGLSEVPGNDDVIAVLGFLSRILCLEMHQLWCSY